MLLARLGPMLARLRPHFARGAECAEQYFPDQSLPLYGSYHPPDKKTWIAAATVNHRFATPI